MKKSLLTLIVMERSGTVCNNMSQQENTEVQRKNTSVVRIHFHRMTLFTIKTVILCDHQHKVINMLYVGIKCKKN